MAETLDINRIDQSRLEKLIQLSRELIHHVGLDNIKLVPVEDLTILVGHPDRAQRVKVIAIQFEETYLLTRASGNRFRAFKYDPATGQVTLRLSSTGGTRQHVTRILTAIVYDRVRSAAHFDAKISLLQDPGELVLASPAEPPVSVQPPILAKRASAYVDTQSVSHCEQRPQLGPVQPPIPDIAPRIAPNGNGFASPPAGLAGVPRANTATPPHHRSKRTNMTQTAAAPIGSLRDRMRARTPSE